jgi:hypothetical protein
MLGPRRYGVQIDKRVVATWKQEYVETLLTHQANRPMLWVGEGNRKLWMFHDRFYWDDEDLEQDDVQALLLQRERRQQQKLQSAHSLMRAEEAGQPTRTPIPTDLRRVVFERDGGEGVECGGSSIFNTTTSCRWRLVAPQRSRTFNCFAPTAIGARATASRRGWRARRNPSNAPNPRNERRAGIHGVAWLRPVARSRSKDRERADRESNAPAETHATPHLLDRGCVSRPARRFSHRLQDRRCLARRALIVWRNSRPGRLVRCDGRGSRGARRCLLPQRGLERRIRLLALFAASRRRRCGRHRLPFVLRHDPGRH